MGLARKARRGGTGATGQRGVLVRFDVSELQTLNFELLARLVAHALLVSLTTYADFAFRD